MRKTSTAPSEAWRRSIFESPPRRDIDRTSKTTTRIPVYLPALNRIAFGEGGNEATALMFFKFLQRFGFIKRFKEQPFAMEELNGPAKRVPDLLVELAHDGSLHVVQCKAKRYMTEEVLARFEQEREFLEPLGFQFHVWTDRDKLAHPTSEAVRMIDRGFCFPPDISVLREIEARAASVRTINPLLREFGWDDVLAAAAKGVFFINVLEKIHEDTAINRHFSAEHYRPLFENRPVPRNWWDSLAPGTATEQPSPDA